MPKATYTNGIQQYNTPQVAIANTSVRGIQPLALPKGPSDFIGTIADIENRGNVDLLVNVNVTHYNQTTQENLGGGSAINQTILSFDSGAIPLNTTWPTGMYDTIIMVLEPGTAKIITGGEALLQDAWDMSIDTLVEITNFSVY